MTTPATPTINSPRDGAAYVDPTADIVIFLSRFERAVQATITETQVPTSLDFGNWINTARLSDGSITKNLMCSSGTFTNGVTHYCSWDGVTYANGDATNRVRAAIIRYRAEIAWDTTKFPDRGTARVRAVMTAGIKGLVEKFSASDTPIWSPSSTDQATQDSFDVFAALEALLGVDYTVKDVEDNGDAIHFHMIGYKGTEGYGTNWGVNDVRLELEFDPADLLKSKHQIQIAPTADPPDFSSPTLDTTDDTALDRGVINADVLASDTEYDMRVRVFDLAGDASAWSTVITFRTMKTTIANMVRSPRANLLPVVVLYPGRWFQAGDWDMPEPVLRKKAYRAVFTRGDEPRANFWIETFEEDGVQVDYTELSQYGTRWIEVNSTAKSFVWIEDENRNHSGNANGELWVHPESDATDEGMHPIGLKSAGLMVRLGIAFSTDEIEIVRPGSSKGGWAAPLLRKLPSFEDRLINIETGAVRTASGTIVLDNGDNSFDKLLGGQRDVPGAGWILHNRPVEIYLMEPGMTLADAMLVFEGVTTWPQGTIETGRSVSIKVSGVSADFRAKRLASLKYDKETYPKLADKNEGRAIPELFGNNIQDASATVVDPDALILRPGKNVTTVTALRVNDITLPTAGWSYTSPYITVIPGTAPLDINPGLINTGDWRWDGSGETFESTTDYKAGAFSRLMLEKAGRKSTDIVTASFNDIDTKAWAGPVRHIVEQEQSIVDAIKLAEVTAIFNVARRPDGKWDAVPTDRKGFSATTLIIEDWRLEQDQEHAINASYLADTLRVRFPNYSSIDGSSPLEIVIQSKFVSAVYGIDKELILDTIHADRTSAQAMADATDFESPRYPVLVTVGWIGLMSFPGEFVALKVDKGLSPDGTLTWDLYRMLGRAFDIISGSVKLELEFVEELAVDKRP